MFDALLSAESSLVSFAQSFDAALLSGEQSLVTVDKLGRMQRLIDGLLAMAAKRVDDTYAYKTRGAKDAAQVIARSTCGTTTAAQAAINVAKRLEALPVTNAAVRAGRLSSRATEMIVNAAVKNPARESELIAIAARGLTPLKDACIRARAEVENPRTRRARQHKARYLRTWTDEDGLYRGSFALAPEEGGQVNAVLDERTREVFRSRRGSEDREELEAYAADAFVGLLLEHEVRVSSETSTTTHRVTNASHPTGSTNTRDRKSVV